MHTLLLTLVLTAAPIATTAGVTVTAPDGWTPTKDGTTFVFTAPDKDAELRVDLYEKEKAGDAQKCVDQLVEKLAAADKVAKDTYAPAVVDGQPASTQSSGEKKHRQRRLVGCNGKSYFLIDWMETKVGGTKYEKAYAALLAGISYAKK
jgi:hypothetical protein